MKHVIYREASLTITASSEDTNNPATYLTGNDYRKKVWKALSGVQTATLRCAIVGTSEVVTVHKTNAETAVCTITLDSAEVQLTDGQPAVDLGGGLVKIPSGGHGLSQGDVALIHGTDNYDGVYTLPSQAGGDASNFVITATYQAETFSNTDTVCEVIKTTTHDLTGTIFDLDRFWEEYTQQTANHTATITLTAGTGETVEAGIVRAGDMLTFINPDSYDRKLKSHSIHVELRNGADYGHAGEVVRAFSYSMVMARSLADDLLDLYKAIDPDPLAFLIADSLSDDNRWCVYGKFDGEPSASYYSPEDDKVSVSVVEVV